MFWLNLTLPTYSLHLTHWPDNVSRVMSWHVARWRDETFSTLLHRSDHSPRLTAICSQTMPRWLFRLLLLQEVLLPIWCKEAVTVQRVVTATPHRGADHATIPKRKAVEVHYHTVIKKIITAMRCVRDKIRTAILKLTARSRNSEREKYLF